ncbi:ribosome biogenesis GTP-binding protein YihA/YsxC [Pontibacter flavimaris]|uniref:Probable GTP-binding protein EngB n=1 Tax=Pontibacter flavimaris TaxID=1797110 RepID=A0A1Q5PAT1_9BACT|nr:ribosome biogenesis GTP-binding protein YihA/YsxC [Pontibacter flavimaris]OKL39346.1 YihA family ribosome biogenesis GTP-binding protein [Pontibacter flavimaris]
MVIKEAKFLMSNTKVEACPTPDKPEYAFIGRSNVGKSSLINMLTEQKKLAKTSGQPGKTQLINHFLINDEWYLVDLPGYGYAKVSKSSREEWRRMINYYLQKRENLTCVFVLIDSRHDPMAQDLEFIHQLGNKGVPFVVVFTKLDKQSSIKTDSTIAAWKRKLRETWEELPQMFRTSSEKQLGRDEILSFIDEVNAQVQDQH